MSSIATMPTLHSIKDVAAQLKVSTKTVRRWIDGGDLPIHRIGRQIRISDVDLITFIRVRREA